MSSNSIVGIVIILAGLYMVIFRKTNLRAFVDYQNSIIKVDFTKKGLKAAEYTIVAMGIFFVVIGVLKVFRIAFYV